MNDACETQWLCTQPLTSKQPYCFPEQLQLVCKICNKLHPAHDRSTLARLTERPTAANQVSDAQVQCRACGSQLWRGHILDEHSCRRSPCLTQCKANEQGSKGLLILRRQQADCYQGRGCNAGTCSHIHHSLLLFLTFQHHHDC